MHLQLGVPPKKELLLDPDFDDEALVNMGPCPVALLYCGLRGQVRNCDACTACLKSAAQLLAATLTLALFVRGCGG